MEASSTVEQLLTLQEIDLEIHQITRQLGELSQELEALQGAAQELEDRVGSLHGDHEAAEERLRRYQRSVQAGRATLKRLEGRAGEVSNMQQHFAVRTETETARRNLRIAEEDALDAMQDVEQLGAEIQQLESDLEESRASLEQREGEAASLRNAFKDELEARRQQKKVKEETLDRRTLRLYETVRNGRTDSVLAPLTGDGVCGHCFTSVPLQQQADIRAGRDLAVCEGCGVILYIPSVGD
jgi:predicted  nucleic acid-binding Zn-ribbon protein